MANYISTAFGVLPGGDVLKIGTDANGLDAIMTFGVAATDGEIVTALGADTLYADGSLYVSVKDGAGKLFQKQNDVWVDLQA